MCVPVPFLGLPVGEEHLHISNGEGQAVLDPKGKPIKLATGLPTTIANDGTITQGGVAVGRIGLFDVAYTSVLQRAIKTPLTL